MYEAHIFLKSEAISNGKITINNLREIKVFKGTIKDTFTSDRFDQIPISAWESYSFVGEKRIINIAREDIRFIEIIEINK